jgi:hypothetical protein
MCSKSGHCRFALTVLLYFLSLLLSGGWPVSISLVQAFTPADVLQAFTPADVISSFYLSTCHSELHVSHTVHVYGHS